MSCENLAIPKPLTSQCPTSVFGIPWGAGGRVVANTAFEIQGIVLHCYSGTISQLCNELKCRTKSSIISGSSENSYHYGIGIAGHVSQFVQDCDISWSFGAYKNNSYANVPPPNVAINWPTLQGINGLNTTPDVYTLDIAIALGHQVDDATGCYQCPTPSGLPQPQHEELVQLLAYLASEHNIPIDTEHITFHDLIKCDESQECPCLDIETLLGQVAAFCPPCEGDEAPSAPEAQPSDNIEHIMGITEACCPSSPGCYVKIPWDGCFVGDLAVDGTLDDYLLGLSYNTATEQYCLTRGCLAVLNPLQGCGTVSDPLGINLCAWGAFVPDQAADDLVMVDGVDAQGCLIQVPVADLVNLYQVPLTVIDTLTIDLTTSGTLDHTLQADLIVSPQPGNQLQVLPDGVFVSEPDCDTINTMFQNAGSVAYVLGLDSSDLCIKQTVAEVVDAGFDVVDTNCIDLSWANNILSATPIISPDTGNSLACRSNGLYVQELTVANTPCINSSFVNGLLSITPVISGPLLGVTNVLTCEQSGLYVPRGANALVNGPLTGNGSETNPLDINFSLMSAQDLCDLGSAIPAGVLNLFVGLDSAGCLRTAVIEDVIADALNVANTNCISMSFIGGVITASPIISGPIASVGNALECTPTGLYVPLSAGLTVQDTNCIDLTLANGVLTATIDVNPAGDNQFTCTPNGAYVPLGAGIEFSTTNCIDINFIGGEVSAFPIISPAQSGVPNSLQCTAQGLYVPETANLIVIDSACIDLTLNNDNELTAAIVLDPNADNQVTCGPAGLYVPPAAGLEVFNTNCITLSLTNGNQLRSTPILAPAQAGVTNALQCLPDGLFVGEAGGQFFITDTFTIQTVEHDDTITFEGENGATVQVSATDTVTVIGHMLCAAGPPTAAPAIGTNQAWSYTDSTNGVTYNWNCATLRWETCAQEVAGTTPPTVATCATNQVISSVIHGVWCPGTSVWTIPAGTGGTTVDQKWLLTEDCVWTKIEGFTLVTAEYTDVHSIPANANTEIPYDLQTADNLNEYDPVTGRFVAASDKCVNVDAGFQFEEYIPAGGQSPGRDYAVHLFLNGALFINLGLETVFADGNTVYTPNARGSATVCLSAGDVLTLGVFHDDAVSGNINLIPGDSFWNTMSISEV